MDEESVIPAVVIRGEESLKSVYLNKELKLRSVIPFVGVTQEGYPRLGFGFFLPDCQAGLFRGSIMPLSLIRSWRAMKILERVGKIENRTLRACWFAATKEVGSDKDQLFLTELAKQFGKPQEFHTFRNEVLSSVPTPPELDLMLTKLFEWGMQVDGQEIRKEVEAGRIATISPLLEKIIQPVRNN